jgi:fibronectin-binding autotransporter adhesin
MAGLLLTGSASAANVTMTGTDAGGTSSFNTAGLWSDMMAPSSGKTYEILTTGVMRSPADNSPHIFAGASLQIDPTAANAGRFLMKGTGGQVMTVGNLIMNGGYADYANSTSDTFTETLAGGITLNASTASGLGAISTETLIVTANISGGGNLVIGGPTLNSGNDTGLVILSGANTFTGNLIVGGGTLSLTGANTYSSGTSLNGGILNLANVQSLGANGKTLTYTNVATTQLSTDTAFGGANPVYNVTVAASGSSSYSGTMVLNRATAGAVTGITHSFGLLTISLNNVNGGLKVLAGANAPTGGAVDSLAFTGLSYGNWYSVSETIAPIGANVSLGTVTPQASYGTGNAVQTLVLDGTSANNQITGIISDNNSGTHLNQAAITKTNSSTWTLSGANTYTGNTTVGGGTLALSGIGSIATTPSITIATNATFNISAVTGPGYANPGGRTLAFNIDKTSGTLKQGQLAIGVINLTYGGPLTVTKSGTDALASGDSFTLVTKTSGTLGGWFSSVTLPVLASGISWDTNHLATAGILDVYSFSTTPLTVATLTNTTATIPAAKLANHSSSSKAASPYPTGWTASASGATLGSVSFDGSHNLIYTSGGTAGTDNFTVTFYDGHGSQTMAVSVTLSRNDSA